MTIKSNSCELDFLCDAKSRDPDMSCVFFAIMII